MSRWRMLVAGLSALAALPAPGGAQSVASQSGVERVVAAGKLWGAIGLFHPYLAYQPIDWDSALVAALPGIRAARSREEYAAAVQQMLNALHDPATRVVGPTSTLRRPERADSQPSARWLADSVLLVTITDPGILIDLQLATTRLVAVAELIGRARGIIFDLRLLHPEDEELLVSYYWPAIGFDSLLAAESLWTPGRRTRVHSGWSPEVGGTSGGYHSSWRVTDGAAVAPGSTTRGAPVVFLVNRNTTLPPVALGLQEAGRAAIVVEGEGFGGGQTSVVRVALPDSVVVEYRLSEGIDRSGAGVMPPDTVVPFSSVAGEANPAFQAGLTMLRRLPQPPRAGRPLPVVGAARAGPVYPELPYPGLEDRLLAAFRIYTIMEYFHPYRNLYGESWDSVLAAFVPRFEGARDSTEYALTAAEMVTHIHDSHGFVFGPVLRSYLGTGYPPFGVLYIEGQPIITTFFNDSAAQAAGARIGDQVLAVDGEPVQARFARLASIISASTPQALQDAVSWRLLRGPDSSLAVIDVLGADGSPRRVEATRSAVYRGAMATDHSGEALRIFPGNIGYVDLERLSPDMVDSMFTMFRATTAIIFDMRGYPQGTAWSIAPRLTDRDEVPAASFWRTVADYPHGSLDTEWGLQSTTMESTQRLPQTSDWRYHGRTVMLIDGRTGSQAEHTGLFFEAANGTKFVGTPSGGYDGDVTNFTIPGGIAVYLSGQGVRHVDGRQLQRVGLQPTVLVAPTIAGFRAGRDEVLEQALAYMRSQPQGGP